MSEPKPHFSIISVGTSGTRGAEMLFHPKPDWAGSMEDAVAFSMGAGWWFVLYSDFEKMHKAARAARNGAPRQP